MQHQPGKFIDKRGQNKGPQKPIQADEPIRPWFGEGFIPARGYALVECRFIGSSESIIIPDAVHQEQQYAIVRAMGPGKLHFDGSVIPPEWQPGDFIYAAIAQGRKVPIEDRMMVVLGTEWIFGKFPDVPEAVVKQFQIDEKKAEEAKQASNGEQSAAAE